MVGSTKDQVTRARLQRCSCTIALALASVCTLRTTVADESSESDVVMRAMVDELDRSVKDLVLSDLPRPYFVQLSANERQSYSVAAAYGGLQRSNENRSRSIGVRVRVGSYELDNTNFRRAFGAAGNLALDDDYTALRHAIWLLIDQDYKQAVETLAQKIAYLKDKTIEDRPDDFSPAPATVAMEPPGKIDFDKGLWEGAVRRLSDKFHAYPKIQDADVTLFAGTVTEWIVNSEGTRLRTGDSGIQLQISATLQADDGMPLGDSLTYIGEHPDQLPPIEKMMSDLEAMCERLTSLAAAPVLEQYTGPVLFEAKAAGTAFETLLSDRLCARPTPLGSGGEDDSFEKKIGLRILPRSFHVVDDSGPQFYDGVLVAGSYRYDDEAVKPSKVQLVEKGILKTLVAGRAPTRKIKQTTGHGRSLSFGDPRASIGCMYLSDDNGLAEAELKQELIQAARDEGLPYALRVAALDEGSEGELGAPIYAYKVYVEDGREEMVRGLHFRPVQPSSMKRILAAGKERKVHNSVSGLIASIIAPATLFEELELTKVDEEFDTLPILKSPALRGK